MIFLLSDINLYAVTFADAGSNFSDLDEIIDDGKHINFQDGHNIEEKVSELMNSLAACTD